MAGVSKLNESDKNRVGWLFTDCFYNSPYYEGWYENKQDMKNDFEECLTWILKNGECLGAYDQGRFVGMALTFSLDKLDAHIRHELFGDEGPLYGKVMTSTGRYLFALCVDKASKGLGVGNMLFDEILKSPGPFVGDVINDISLKMCQKRGFICEKLPGQLSCPWWWVEKK